MKRISITFFLFILFFTLSSHELFLKSDSYFLEKNNQSELFLFNGTFDQSENVITRDRIINSQIIGPDFNFKPTSNDFYDKDKATYLRFKTGDPGTYVVGISTKSKAIKLSSEEFTEYLEHEGLNKIILERKNKGITNKSANEKYAKHVKAIVQVDKNRTENFSTELNYPIEFIPLKNPYKLSIGDEMSFKLLYLGKPLGNQTVHISSRINKDAKEGKETALRTDENGEVSFTISNEGHWYIATIHMFESIEEEFDYESNWATLTFEVK